MKNWWGIMAMVVAVLALFWLGGCKKDQQSELQGVAPAAVAVNGEQEEQAVAKAASENDGRSLFQKHCAVCHPGGGNIINPQKTLDGQSLSASGIETVGDIVANMRQPGPGMTRFDENLLSDREAARIAEYILQKY